MSSSSNRGRIFSHSSLVGGPILVGGRSGCLTCCSVRSILPVLRVYNNIPADVPTKRTPMAYDCHEGERCCSVELVDDENDESVVAALTVAEEDMMIVV